MSFAAGGQNNNLLKLQACRFREPEDPQVRKVFAQQSRALCQAELWNHKDQHSSRFKPTIRVLQKNGFQSLVIARARFPIVGGIQVQQRQRFGRAAHLHGVRLKSLNARRSRQFHPISVDLNSIATSRCLVKQVSERHAIADTGIERRELVWESEPILQPLSLGYGKRKETELGLAMWTQE